MKKGFVTVMLSVLLSVLAAYGVVKAATVDYGDKVARSERGVEYRTVNLSQSDYPDFTYAAESAVDAVVYVEVTVTQRYQLTDPFYRFFFGEDREPQLRKQQGSGSGVIVRPDGYIVTNNHVVANATEIKVTLTNNKTYDAKIIGTDPATDVALLKIDGQGLPTIPFGDSDQLRLGEWVLAIGSPLGYQLRSTITAGIVSAKGRAMGGGAYENDPYGRISGRSQLQIESFIQTDAAVNPGNSGGALVNKKGELVGINTAIVSQTGSYSGYSFAIPSNIVRKVVGDLIDFGSVKRAVLGISMSEISEGLVTALNQDLPKSEQYSSLDDLMKKLKLSSLDGVYIREVVKGGAADKAGIQVGDVLTKIDGVEMANGGAVQEKVNSFHPGDKAKITIIRGGKEKNVEVTFQSSSSETGTEVAEGEIAFYGTTLKAASQEALEKFGLKNGVEIVSVSTGKMLEAGASEGFIITFVNDQPVSKPQDVVDIAKAARRSIYIEGITANGRKAYFGFGKD